MSREIKFRGYDIDDKRWIFGTPLEYTKCVVCFTEDDRLEQHETRMIFTEMTDWGFPEDVKVCKTIDKDSVGQYTGLRDDSGTEIYEGDIVTGWFDHEKITGYIFYGSDAKFYIERNGLFGIGLNNAQDWTEVIGNIYENPELLEGEHDRTD